MHSKSHSEKNLVGSFFFPFETHRWSPGVEAMVIQCNRRLFVAITVHSFQSRFFSWKEFTVKNTSD